MKHFPPRSEIWRRPISVGSLDRSRAVTRNFAENVCRDLRLRIVCIDKDS